MLLRGVEPAGAGLAAARLQFRGGTLAPQPDRAGRHRLPGAAADPPPGSDRVQLLRTPLLWLAGASVLLVHCPGGLLVLPGVPSVQADTLASILTEDAV